MRAMMLGALLTLAAASPGEPGQSPPTALFLAIENAPLARTLQRWLEQDDTRWSLSIAPPRDFCAERSDDAARFRQEAIDAYEVVLTIKAQSEGRNAYTRRQLRRLRAGYDTGARFFFDCYP